MTVHQVKAAASELQPQQEVEQLQLAVGRLHLVHCPLEVLVCHSRVPVQEEGGEEEEALEGEADNLCPARQGQQASGQRPGGRPLGGRDPELVFTSISLDRDNSRDWNLGRTSLALAASCYAGSAAPAG